MLHPAVLTLISQPGLLAEHAGAYSQLAWAEVAQAVLGARRKAALVVAAIACVALGGVLVGMALLLLAVVPVPLMPAPWALALGPALPLLTAALLWAAQRRLTLDLRFANLRQQLDADRALLRQLDQP
jgi:hypothetical protein